MISMILFLNHPIELHAQMLRDQLGRALGVQFGQDKQDDNFIISLKPGVFPIAVGDLKFGLINVATPYFKTPPPNLDRYDTRVRQALVYHKAWLSIDMADRTAAQDKTRAYPVLGRMLAQIVEDQGENVMGLASTETKQMMWRHDFVVEKLRSGNPLSALERPERQMVNVRDDDPEMVAAVAEARRRWPEFVAAFARRTKGQGFSVKAPITADGHTEFMWVSPREITGDVIRGTLASDPARIRSLKPHDPVEVKVADLNDWLYEDGATNRGGFTIQVLQRRATAGAS